MHEQVNKILNIIVTRWRVAVGIAVLATFVLVLFLGKGQDVWFDESYSILIAQKPVPELIRLTGVDAHPPLFYLLLKAWGSVFGWSELSLRSMSAIVSASTIGVVAIVIRRLFTIRTALIALPFLVLSPFWLRYGYEIRMYVLAGFIGALASLILVRATHAKSQKKWWILYALTVAAGLYTLYTTVIIWLAHFVWLMVYRRKQFWRQAWFKAYVGSALLFLPYIPTVIFQMTHSALPGIGWTLSLTHFWEVASVLLLYTPEWSVTSWAALGVIVLVALTIYLIDRSRHQMSSKERQSLGFMTSLAVVPFLFYIIISLPMSQPFFLPRYLAHVSLFMYALLGLATALGWKHGYYRTAALQGLLALLLLLWGLGQLVQAGNFNYERMQRPQTVSLRQTINCDKELVVADDPYTYIDNSYYFGGCRARFYTAEPLKPWGGYAPLLGSKDQLESSNQLQAKTVVHVYWNNFPKTFYIDSRYKLISSVIYDQQVADTYQLIEK